MNINDIICVQPKGFVMMPTEEELKDPWVARLYLKNPSVVPNLPPKTSAPPTEVRYKLRVAGV